MHAFHLNPLLNLRRNFRSRPNTIIMHNPVPMILKVVHRPLPTDQPYKERYNRTCSQPNTEWDEACSEEFTGNVPSEGIGVERVVEGPGVVTNCTNNTAGEWTEEALDAEDEGDAGGEEGAGLDDFLLQYVEYGLQQAGNHSQHNRLCGAVN